MGIPLSGATDLANRVFTGTINSVARTIIGGAGTGMCPPCGGFNLLLQGAFTGNVNVERSFDGGVSWTPALGLDGRTPLSFTAPGGCTPQEIEPGVLYALNCTALSAGTPTWRVSW